MTTAELRKAIIQGLKIVDRRTLKMIYSILWESIAPDDGVEEKELKAELRKIAKAYKSAKSKSLSVAEPVVAYGIPKKKRGLDLTSRSRIVKLSSANEAELERRITEYESGKGKSFTAAAAKVELRRRISKK